MIKQETNTKFIELSETKTCWNLSLRWFTNQNGRFYKYRKSTYVPPI